LDYYDATSATFTWGYGLPGRSLRPYLDAAVGSSYFGGTFYIPELSNYGPTYGGIFYGVDQGGRIKDGTIDIFTGLGLGSQDANLMGIDSTPVYQVICD
jgi:hypothetical protein